MNLESLRNHGLGSFLKAVQRVRTIGRPCATADITNMDRLHSSVAETLLADIAEAEVLFAAALSDGLEPAG